MLTRSLWHAPSRFYSQKLICAYFATWFYYCSGAGCMRAFHEQSRKQNLFWVSQDQWTEVRWGAHQTFLLLATLRQSSKLLEDWLLSTNMGSKKKSLAKMLNLGTSWKSGCEHPWARSQAMLDKHYTRYTGCQCQLSGYCCPVNLSGLDCFYCSAF